MPRLDYYADFLAPTQRIDKPGEVLVLDGWSKILEPSPDGWWPDDAVGKTAKRKGYPRFELANGDMLLCKGADAWERFFPTGDGGYVYLTHERGVSGGEEFRVLTDSTGSYPWTRSPGKPGMAWNCHPAGGYAETRVTYSRIFRMGRVSDAEAIYEMGLRIPTVAYALNDWKNLTRELAFLLDWPSSKRPTVKVVVRDEDWGNDFEHVEFYVEGHCGGIALGRIGWIKARMVDGELVIERVSCYYKPRLTDFRPSRNAGLPGWEPEEES